MKQWPINTIVQKYAFVKFDEYPSENYIYMIKKIRYIIHDYTPIFDG